MTSHSFICCIVIVFSNVVSCLAEKPAIFEGSLSPDKRTAIRNDPNLPYEFVDMRSGKGIGVIHPAEDRSNISITTSWSPDSSRVAFRMHYGTKLSGLFIFQRTWRGVFVELPFNQPNPIEVFNEKHLVPPFPEYAAGYSENYVGPWITKSIVRFIAGEAKEEVEKGHLFVAFDANMSHGVVTLSNIQLHGPMTDDEAERFLKAVGAH